MRMLLSNFLKRLFITVKVNENKNRKLCIMDIIGYISFLQIISFKRKSELKRVVYFQPKYKGY